MQQLLLPGIKLWMRVEGIKGYYVLRCSKLWREWLYKMNSRPAWLDRVTVIDSMNCGVWWMPKVASQWQILYRRRNPCR